MPPLQKNPAPIRPEYRFAIFILANRHKLVNIPHTLTLTLSQRERGDDGHSPPLEGWREAAGVVLPHTLTLTLSQRERGDDGHSPPFL